MAHDRPVLADPVLLSELTRLEDKPVILAEKQREPGRILRTQQSRVTGFGGCNSLTGGYRLDGGELTFGRIAATRMACLQGMDTEAAFFKALERVRAWKILGQHLELYDAGGDLVARFEARAVAGLIHNPRTPCLGSCKTVRSLYSRTWKAQHLA
jgi:heat shock protein HslJ